MNDATRRLADGPMLRAPLRRRGRTAAFRAVALLAAAAILVILHGPLLTGFARSFRFSNPGPADALLVLEFESDEPAQLYRRGWAPRVLMIAWNSVPFRDLNPFTVAREILVRRGIPSDAIRVLPAVHVGADFPEVAARVREDLQRNPVQTLMVAVSAAHSARAHRAFSEALRGLEVELRIAAVPSPWFDESNWYRSDEGIIEYFSETIQVLREFVAG